MSTATVSRALAGKSSVSPATKARVEAAAKQLGYVVSAAASSLASGRTRNVGVVMPYLDSWFFMAVLKGAQRTLADAGYDVTLYHLAPADGLEIDSESAQRRSRLFDEFLRRQRVDALIAVNLELDDHERTALGDLSRPVVGLGGPLPGLHTLSLDDTGVARLATDHLLALGHRSIAHITGDPDFERDFQMPATRRAGYEASLVEAGIEPDPLLVRHANFTIEGGYDATLRLLGDPRVHPTAIFAASDEMAIGALLAARDLGRTVPGDLSIVGIDGHDLADFFGLTTIDQFPEVQGQQVAQIVIDELTGQLQDAVDEDLPYELVVRRSTSRLREA
ncbi:LacI family DNA-binding transcriptional regulator [Demequina litorisediminis]|uniref:LacI family transcriptional regulator n=1 Tax=Demequina litorisediminis TaxID=1849022 RepID=A0ABQ6I9D1_9MICO|nr:LacI family DNA-binding transcriptional regulator [Demequina litorisediminis]GMA34056.1 LacI family transcriptional regulator [Demequina litorisediminis]